jgi:hypothetical protein
MLLNVNKNAKLESESRSINNYAMSNKGTECSL